MENLITGYQYGDDFSFIGPYPFYDNLDQDGAHLPPRTTLIAPPADIPPGHEAAFDVATDAWIIRPEDLSWMDDDSRIKYLASLEV